MTAVRRAAFRAVAAAMLAGIVLFVLTFTTGLTPADLAAPIAWLTSR